MGVRAVIMTPAPVSLPTLRSSERWARRTAVLSWTVAASAIDAPPTPPTNAADPATTVLNRRVNLDVVVMFRFLQAVSTRRTHGARRVRRRPVLHDACPCCRGAPLVHLVDGGR